MGIYNGGNKAGVTTSTNISLNGSSVTNLYGGSNQSGDVATTNITTTIITKNRIFVPVIPEMYQYFDLAQNQGKLEFYVRFDPLTA